MYSQFDYHSYRAVVKHVSTQWLSLELAGERGFRGLTSYLKSKQQPVMLQCLRCIFVSFSFDQCKQVLMEGLATYSYPLCTTKKPFQNGHGQILSTTQGCSHRYSWYSFHCTTFSRRCAMTTGKVRRRGSITVRAIRPAASAHTCVEDRIAREHVV